MLYLNFVQSITLILLEISTCSPFRTSVYLGSIHQFYQFSCLFTVEKATVLSRLLETDTVLHNKTIHTALAHIFCLLIGSLEDINASVAQRASQYLETIKNASIKVSQECFFLYAYMFFADFHL